MKILWISGILIGCGLITGGAIYHYYGSDTDYVVLAGMGCMALGGLARRQVFKRR